MPRCARIIDDDGVYHKGYGCILIMEPGEIRRVPQRVSLFLGWERKTSFEQLVNMMTDADLKLAEREKRADG